MINFIFIFLIFISFMSLFSAVYISSSIYSLYAILQPKFLWPWTFPNIPFSFLIALSVIFGIVLFTLRGKIKINYILRKEFLLLILLCLMMHTSKIFSPFQNYAAGVSSDVVLGTITTITIMYFFQVSAISFSVDRIKALKYHVFVFLVCVVYYIYWANERYLSGNWSYFRNGRLTGPAQGPYSDENILAVLIVMGMPFFLNIIFYSKKKTLTILSFVLLLGAWHTIFLFGSRGAFLGTLVVLIFSFNILSSKDTPYKSSESFLLRLKIFKKIIIMIFGLAILTQAGTLLNRSGEIINKTQNSESESVNPRIDSWKVGLKLARDFPIFGVGPQRFQQASSVFYPGETVHVAHNTYLNFAANTGIPSALLFVSILVIHLRRRKKNARLMKDSRFCIYLNDSIFLSLTGFAICSFFLDLIIFEPLYFILILSHSFSVLIEQEHKRDIHEQKN